MNAHSYRGGITNIQEVIMVRKIRTAAVIGSGVMGGGIAALLAGAGVKTLLLDIVPFDLKDEEKSDPVARNRIAQIGGHSKNVKTVPAHAAERCRLDHHRQP